MSGSFYNLLNKELGATSGTTAATNIVQLPLAFVRSGWVINGLGYVSSVGSNGNYWSRTANSVINGYRLYFTAGNVSPSGNYNRDLGFSLRCLYPGSA